MSSNQFESDELNGIELSILRYIVKKMESTRSEMHFKLMLHYPRLDNALKLLEAKKLIKKTIDKEHKTRYTFLPSELGIDELYNIDSSKNINEGEKIFKKILLLEDIEKREKLKKLYKEAKNGYISKLEILDRTLSGVEFIFRTDREIEEIIRMEKIKKIEDEIK